MLAVALLILVAAVVARFFGFGLMLDASLAAGQVLLFLLLAALTFLGGGLQRPRRERGTALARGASEVD